MLSRVIKRLAPYKDRKAGILFTAGPLSTSRTVREAMMTDYGSRDTAFTDAVVDIRRKLVEVAGVDASQWSATPMQGSGSMGIEASLRTFSPKQKNQAHLVVLCNGHYGHRIADMGTQIGMKVDRVVVGEGDIVNPAQFEEVIAANAKTVTNVAYVHSETTSGMLNPIEDLSAISKKYCPDAVRLCDAMSSFGAVQYNVENTCDVVVSSANKCIQGVPGFSFSVARKGILSKFAGCSDSPSLDICKQAAALDKNAQFFNTPPVHSLMAFHQAIKELEQEGGVIARQARYQALRDRIIAGMCDDLGFKLFLAHVKENEATSHQFGWVITSFLSPTKDPNWSFEKLYHGLKERGFVIYPGKTTEIPSFRLGSLGDVALEDVDNLIVAMKEVLKEMQITFPLKY